MASHKFSAIVLAGDFNGSKSSLENLLPAAAAFQFRTIAEGTRISSQGKWSSLDYIASTAPISVATRFGHLSKSDHSPIGAKILAKIIIKPTATVLRVDKAILTVNVAKKLKESHWPLKQANRDVVAKQIMHKVATLKY